MSQQFIVVNRTRSEFFRPMTLGESGKLGGVPDGRFTALAVSLLAVRSTAVTLPERAAQLDQTAFGSWHGGALDLVGSYQPGYDGLIDGLTDISFCVVAMLCWASGDALAHFVEAFGQHNANTVVAGHVAFGEQCRPLVDALYVRYGADWPAVYKRVRQSGTVPHGLPPG